ncbi:MAG: NAD-dependent epimerase/dehydratase family protein, partial [Candidatus Competibacteraceae bacterium]|nr:NAD-dependent epimerase/dehydratase family protein [Candidatus Competibacteraceae bacterium]
MSKTALVIGATGLVGSALVNQLGNANPISKIITITRRPVKHISPKVFNQAVDFEHLEDCAALFSGDYLFSCLGTTRRQAGSVDAQRKVDLGYQFTAAQLAAKNGVRHYLLVSSSGATKKA